MYESIEAFTIAIHESENDEVIKRGRIDSILRQYSRKACDFQRPWTATTSGGTPQRRSSVAPPIWKQCPVSSKRLADLQIWLQRAKNHGFVIAAQHPSAVSYAKNGASGGTAVLAARWWLTAVNAFVLSFKFEIMISAPSPWDVFVHGMWRTEYFTPSGGARRVKDDDHETWREELKELVLTKISSPSLCVVKDLWGSGKCTLYIPAARPKCCACDCKNWCIKRVGKVETTKESVHVF